MAAGAVIQKRHPPGSHIISSLLIIVVSLALSPLLSAPKCVSNHPPDIYCSVLAATPDVHDSRISGSHTWTHCHQASSAF